MNESRRSLIRIIKTVDLIAPVGSNQLLFRTYGPRRIWYVLAPNVTGGLVGLFVDRRTVAGPSSGFQTTAPSATINTTNVLHSADRAIQ